MGKLEALQKRIDFLIQDYRGYFLVLVTMIGGEIGAIYAVIADKKPIYSLIIGIIGIFFIVGVFWKLISIKEEIEKLTNELEEV